MFTDFYNIASYLSDSEFDFLDNVSLGLRSFTPSFINKHWTEDSFVPEIIDFIKRFGLNGLGISQGSKLLAGLVTLELARVDVSLATFFDIHNGLVIRSIYNLGTEEQKAKWLPSLYSMDKIGCFAMTEPDSGSDAQGGISTTAMQGGDGDWILNGKKRWIGNAPFADVAIVWARDPRDNKLKGFIVEGFKAEKIENKFGLKIVQNGVITFKDHIIPKENRLEGRFQDILRQARYVVGWEAIGCMIGSFEYALQYSKERKQFGKPIASFQLIQDLLAKMISNITACQTLAYQCGQLDEKGELTDAQVSMCKAFCTSKARETVAMGREILGGNGLSIDYNVGRYFTDAEALYSYEGTYQMQNLIIGRNITGISAFV